MIARYFGPVALALGLAVSSFSPAAAATSFSDWKVTQTFKGDGSTTCLLQVGVERGGTYLSVDGRLPKKSRTVAPYVVLSGLPPILAGKKGTMRDITINIGGWALGGVKAEWGRGSADNNSRMTMQLPAGEWQNLLNALSSASNATISFTLANGTHNYSMNYAPTSAPAAAYAECLS